MVISKVMEDIIHRELDDRAKKASSQRIEYEVSTKDTRAGAEAATVTFKLSKPVPLGEAEERSRGLLKSLARELDSRQLGVIDAILAQYGLADRVGRRRTKGSVQVRLGDHEETGRTAGINTAKGKLISENNLRGLLELVAKDYLIRDMRKPNAPLKYRTGRFANSMKVNSVRLQDSTGGKPSLSIFYKYMTYPYATFDPMKSSRPEMYMRPSPGARNPQVHIGTALAKAARDIIHSRYRIDVREAL